MGGMRPASAASEAIEAEVSLKVWDVLHGTLRWASEADGPCEAGGGGVLPREARLPPVGLASSPRRRRTASTGYLWKFLGKIWGEKKISHFESLLSKS